MNFVRATVAALTGLLVGRSPTTVGLNDDIALQLSVVPGLGDTFARTNRIRYLDLVVQRGTGDVPDALPSLQVLIDRLGENIIRCTCEDHVGLDDHHPVWVLQSRRHPGFDNGINNWPAPYEDCGVNGFTSMDLWMAALPLLCREMLLHSWLPISTAGPPNPVGIHPTKMVVDDLKQWQYTGPAPTCPHVGTDEDYRPGSLDVTGDSYVYKKIGRYGASRSRGPWRCYWCYEEHAQSLAPAIWDLGTGRVEYRTAEWWAADALRLAQLVEEKCMPSTHLTLTSWSLSLRRDLARIPTLKAPCVVLVETRADCLAVDAFRESTGTLMWPLPVNRIVNGRSLGNLRVIYANTVRCDVIVQIVDTHLKTAGILDREAGQPAAYIHTLTHLASPCADMGAMMPGRSLAAVLFPLSRALLFLDVWGLDEALLDRFWQPVCMMSAATAALDLEWGFPLNLTRMSRLVLANGGDPLVWIGARHGTRLSTLAAFREVVNSTMGIPTRVPLVSMLGLGYVADHNLDVPQLRATPTRGSLSVASPTSTGSAVAGRLGRITWFVLGSRGDVVPPLAIARHLRKLGLDIEVVRPHTEEQGLEMLRAVETGALLSAAPMFAHSWLMCASTSGIKVGPPEFPGLDVSVSLRPPSTVIRPVDFRAGLFLNWLLENLIRDERNLWNIGCYPGLRWLPRSQDGTTFLKRSTVPVAGRPIQIAVDMGSSSLAAPSVPGAVPMPKPYSYKDMERVQVVVGHGGAGSVQSYAAAGVTYVSVDNALDRDYYDPLDCGRGTVFTGDPDNAMLMFLELDPSVWMWAYSHSYRMLWRALVVFATRRGYQLAWLAFVCLLRLLRTPATLLFSVGPMAAVFAGALARWVPVWVSLTIAPYALDAIHFVVKWTGKTWYEIAHDLGILGLRVTESGSFWVVLALTDSIGLALLTGLGGQLLGPATTLMHIGMTMMGALEVPDPAYIGISFAFPDIPVPLFHIRFFNGSRTRRFEGNWGTEQGGMWQPYTVRTSTYRVDLPGELVLKTSIPWAHFENLPAQTAPYSVLWNCQSSAVVATWPVWGGMGLASFILLPSAAWGIVAYCVILILTATLILLLNVVPILYVVMEAAGLVHYIKPLRSMAMVMMSRLTNPRLPIYARAMQAIVGVSIAWGRPNLSIVGDLYADMLAVVGRTPPGAERDDELRATLRAYPVLANDYFSSQLLYGFISLAS